jgi:hypothetical protein
MSLTSWPASLLPSRYTLNLVPNTQSGGVSPYDRTEQVIVLPGEQWRARLVFENLDRIEARTLGAFLAAQQGRAGVFFWSPPALLPRGTVGADGQSPVVDGANQTGRSLNLRGLLANRPAVFQPDDMLMILDAIGRPWLHRVLGTGGSTPVFGAVAKNATGRCTVALAPPLRRAPVDGSGLGVWDAGTRWRLASNENPMEFTPGMLGNASIDLVEAL